MATSRRPLVAGNWKMNGLAASAGELGKIIAGAAELSGRVDLMVCPPATLLAAFVEAARGSSVAIGGQDCHAEAAGAVTRGISPALLEEAGATAGSIRPSQRRGRHQGNDEQVRGQNQPPVR